MGLRLGMMTNVGIYEFNPKDLIGHGAFAVVYKGRLKSVSAPSSLLFVSLLSSTIMMTIGWLCTFRQKR